MGMPAELGEIVAHARDPYATAKVASEEATDLLQSTYAAVAKGATAYNLKAFEIARTNTQAAFAYAHELRGVKSPSEFIELSTAHMRKEFDIASTQNKDIFMVLYVSSLPLGSAAVATSEPSRQRQSETQKLIAAQIAGRQVYKKGQACHALEVGKNALGPSLAGIFEKKSGETSNYAYSQAMKAANVICDAGYRSRVGCWNVGASSSTPRSSISSTRRSG
jgi:hypothetical protein